MFTKMVKGGGEEVKYSITTAISWLFPANLQLSVIKKRVEY